MVASSRASCNLFHEFFSQLDPEPKERQDDSYSSSLEGSWSPLLVPDGLLSEGDLRLDFEGTYNDLFSEYSIREEESKGNRNDLSEKVVQNTTEYSEEYPKQVVEIVIQLVDEMKGNPERKYIGWVRIAKRINELFSLKITNEDVRALYEKNKVVSDSTLRNRSLRTFRKTGESSSSKIKESSAAIVKRVTEMVDEIRINPKRKYINWVNIAATVNNQFAVYIPHKVLRTVYSKGTAALQAKIQKYLVQGKKSSQ